MNPQVFGKEHLLYIAVSMVTALVVCLLTGRFAKTEKAQNALILWIVELARKKRTASV